MEEDGNMYWPEYESYEHLRRREKPDLHECLSEIFDEFLQIFTHSVLFKYSVYPVEAFVIQKYLGLPIHLCRHKGVCRYITKVMSTIKNWYRERELLKVGIFLTDESNNAIERFVISIFANNLPTYSNWKKMGIRPKDMKELKQIDDDFDQLEENLRNCLLTLQQINPEPSKLERIEKFRVGVRMNGKECVKQQKTDGKEMSWHSEEINAQMLCIPEFDSINCNLIQLNVSREQNKDH